MTELELLDYTKNNFNSTNRCVASIGDNQRIQCKYSPKTLNLEGKSKGCAIGCHLTEENAVLLDEKLHATASIHYVMLDSECINLLPKWMQKMDPNFLQAIQSLHDNKINWDENGVTALGMSEYKKIKQKLTNGEYN